MFQLHIFICVIQLFFNQLSGPIQIEMLSDEDNFNKLTPVCWATTGSPFIYPHKVIKESLWGLNFFSLSYLNASTVISIQ